MFVDRERRGELNVSDSQVSSKSIVSLKKGQTFIVPLI